MKEWLAKQAEIETWLDRITPVLASFGKDILAALFLFFIGRRLVKWLNKLLKRSFERSNMEEGLSNFLLSLINISLNVVVIFISLSVFDAVVTSIMAVLGSAGLTLGLALQGSLSNFAGGVLILIMKPFQVGDYIITGAKEEGTVVGIDVFYTHLLTVDNKRVVIPNGGLSNASIINVTREPIRRLDILVSVDYSENIKKVKDILLKLAQSQKMALMDRPVDVYVNSFDPSAISIGLRIWTKTEDYWTLKWKLLEEIKEEFDKNQIVIPFDQLDVNVNGGMSGVLTDLEDNRLTENKELPGNMDTLEELEADYKKALSYLVRPDYEEGVRMIKELANKGYAPAQYKLGMMYYESYRASEDNTGGIARDYKKAAEWYQKAAGQGNSYAQYELGRCYADGKGVDKDIDLALMWYRTAAAQENSYAQYELGLCYYYGDGVEKDKGITKAWWQKAAVNGNANAKVRLEEVKDIEAKEIDEIG